MKRVIASLGSAEYVRGIQRLSDSLDANGYLGERRLLTEFPAGCPAHCDVPYAFKPFILKQLMDEGYDQVMWCDAAVVAVKPLDRLWWLMRRDGCLLPLNWDSVGRWCSDAALVTTGITREQAMAMRPHVWMCVAGLDLTCDRSREFLKQWYDYAMDGVSFVGSWSNDSGQVSRDPRVLGHRHDQTIAGILAYRLGMPFNEEVVQYDSCNIMPIVGYREHLRIPAWPVPFLHIHNAGHA